MSSSSARLHGAEAKAVTELGRSGFALLSGLALACAATGAYASSGTVNGEVHNAATLAPATKGSASLTINGAPWGATATIDPAGQFDFEVVTWLTGCATIVTRNIDRSGKMADSFPSNATDCFPGR